MDFDNEIPKYKKKSNGSVSKAMYKSKHKHKNTGCLLIHKGKPYIASYCLVCGKIKEWDYCKERYQNGTYRLLSDDEVYTKYKDLEQIEVDNLYQKYLPMPE